MSEDTSLDDKDTIDRTQVFAVYNVYRLVIGSVLFALTLSDTGSGLLSDDIALQTTGAGIFVISSLIIALLGSPSKFTTESGIFGVMMMDVVDGDLDQRFHMDSIERQRDSPADNAMTKYRWNKTARRRRSPWPDYTCVSCQLARR